MATIIISLYFGKYGNNIYTLFTDPFSCVYPVYANGQLLRKN